MFSNLNYDGQVGRTIILRMCHITEFHKIKDFN